MANGSVNFKIGNIFERALWQGIQTAIGTLLPALGVVGTSGALATTDSGVATGKAAVAAGLSAAIATALSIVKNMVVTARPATASANLIQRLAWTFVFAAVAALPAGAIYLNLDFAKASLLAAISAGGAAVFSAAKNLTAEGVLTEAQVRARIGTTPLP